MVEYRELGKSGIKVSAVGVGTYLIILYLYLLMHAP